MFSGFIVLLFVCKSSLSRCGAAGCHWVNSLGVFYCTTLLLRSFSLLCCCCAVDGSIADAWPVYPVRILTEPRPFVYEIFFCRTCSANRFKQRCKAREEKHTVPVRFFGKDIKIYWELLSWNSNSLTLLIHYVTLITYVDWLHSYRQEWWRSLSV